MAVHKRERKKFFHKAKSIALAIGITAVTIFGACKKPEPESIRCYDYDKQTLKVHNGKEEKQLSLSHLGVKEDKPLDYFCTRSGHLFWLTKDNIHVKRIIHNNGVLTSQNVISVKHTKPDEYKPSDVSVIDGDIGGNPRGDWQKIKIATLTNTGLFQVMSVSVDSLANDKPNRAIFNFMNDNDVEPSERWPEKNVSSGIVRVLNNSEFSIIPIGKKDLGTIRNYYYLKVTGELRTGDWSIGTLRLWKKNPKLKNIYSVETRYEESSGGHIGNFHCETNDNKQLILLQTLTPYSK